MNWSRAFYAGQAVTVRENEAESLSPTRNLKAGAVTNRTNNMKYLVTSAEDNSMTLSQALQLRHHDHPVTVSENELRILSYRSRRAVSDRHGGSDCGRLGALLRPGQILNLKAALRGRQAEPVKDPRL
jgi:hypothetical protein